MKIVAVKERSAGNEEVGNMWLETKIYDASTPIREIVEWGQRQNGGRLIITVPDNKEEE